MSQTSPPLAKVITVSAVYGAGGSVIAPRVAERLNMQFFDRLVHSSQPHDVDALAERLTDEEQRQAPAGRLTKLLPQLTSVFGMSLPSPDDIDPVKRLRVQVEESVLRIAAGDGGVILGRAAAVVMAGLPSAFHVRLFGNSERCLHQGAAIEGVSLAVGREHQAESDRAWSRFVSRLFERDPADPSLYHLLIDTTSIPLDDCVGIVASAATAFWGRDPSASGSGGVSDD